MTRWWKKLEALLFEDTSTGGAKFSTLDGLRGIAVLVVFLSHSSGFNQRILPGLNFRSLGHLGVYLFFALSGFMLAYGLLGRSRTPFLGFYARRFLRIAPLYYLIVTLTFVMQNVLHSSNFCWLQIDGGWIGYVRHLLFLQGDSVFWTIAAEFQFYFILPVLVWLLVRFRDTAAWALLAVAILYGAWAVLIDLGHIDKSLALRLADIAHNSQYLDVFLCGMLAAYLARKDWWIAWTARIRPHLSLSGLALCALVAIVSLVFIAKNFLFFGQVWAPLRNFSFLYGAAFAAIILCASYGSGLLDRILNNVILRMIGITCFSWYLVHFIVINGVNALLGFHWYPKLISLPWTPVEPLRFALSFIITFFVAIGLYLGVEKPFMKLSRTFLGTRKPVATPA